CREITRKLVPKCSVECPKSSKVAARSVLPVLAASLIIFSRPSQVLAADSSDLGNICQLASATDGGVRLPINDDSPDGSGKFMMMRGMTAKDFDPVRYSGRWFEVASLKRGFAGQGQEGCHCTQGIYTFDMDAQAIQVDTFCIHGGPDGYIAGRYGENETDLERQEMIKEKCYL
ncbi:hypothetical protein RJ641_034716, partial [Dillenia turbinata]